jgi:hypothetical protein
MKETELVMLPPELSPMVQAAKALVAIMGWNLGDHPKAAIQKQPETIAPTREISRLTFP